MLEPEHQRPDYKAAAAFVDSHSSPRDVVIDASVLSPGPFAGLDVALDRSLPVIRAGAPQERDHPFGYFDPIFPLGKGRENGRSSQRQTRIPGFAPNGSAACSRTTGLLSGRPRSGRQARARLSPRRDPDYPGILPIEVQMYQKKRSS